jgi:hypothetical protein
LARLSKSDADDRLLGAIEAASENSYGSEQDSELGASRALSIRRYLGENIDPAPAGMSQVRDRTTFEVIEWTKPSLLRIFCSTDEVAKFEAQGPEDEAASEQESDFINYVVTQRNPWLQICHDWFHDALTVKNGYVYAYWKDRKSTEIEEYENLSDDAATILLNDADLEIVGHDQRPDDETNEQNAQAYQQAMQQYEMQAMQMQQAAQQQAMQQPQQPGQPPQLPPPPQPPQPAYLHDIQIRRTNERGHVCIEVLAPERTKISIDTKSFTLDDCDYFEFWDYKTIGSLRADGFDVPDDVGSSEDYDRWQSEEDARDRFNEQAGGLRVDSNRGDPASRIVQVRRVWIRHDYDGDGINELQYVVLIGGEIFHRSETPEIPVASITPIPMPHRHIGMSLAETVEDIEDIATNITRAALNNINLSNTPRIAVSDRVNMDDLLDVRVGGIIRVDGQPPQELMPVVTPDVFPSAMGALSFFDSRRQNRTGINAYFQGTDANAINKTASGISQLTSSAAQRVEMIARIFSHGVARLFLIVHRLTLQHGRKKETVKLRNKWTVINPSEWRHRTDLKITVGLGTGSKDGMIAMLSQLFMAQMQTIPLGVTNPGNVYRTMIEMAKAAGFNNAEAFFNDPSTNPPPPPPPPDPAIVKAQIDSQSKQQLEQMGIQKELQVAQMRSQFEAQMLQQKQMFDKWKVEFETAAQFQLEQLKQSGQIQVAQEQIGLQDRHKQIDLSIKQEEMDRQKNDSDGEMQSKSDVSNALKAITEAVQSISQMNSMPKEIVRDASGRVTGVRPVST